MSYAKIVMKGYKLANSYEWIRTHVSKNQT